MPEDTNPTETTDAQEATTTTDTAPETFDREYVEKLRKENATYRTKAKAAEEAAAKARLDAERQKLDEVERLKAEKADADKRVAELEAKATAAERRAALTGKVADPTAALKLLDPEQHLTEDGSVNVDALLETYPFLAPGKTPTQASTPGAGGNIASKQTQLASLQDQLKNAKNMAERVSLQRQIHELQKG